MNYGLDMMEYSERDNYYFISMILTTAIYLWKQYASSHKLMIYLFNFFYKRFINAKNINDRPTKPSQKIKILITQM